MKARAVSGLRPELSRSATWSGLRRSPTLGSSLAWWMTAMVETTISLATKPAVRAMTSFQASGRL